MTASRDAHLERLGVFVEWWRRGDRDGFQVVVDCLTNLRHFAGSHAVDFDDTLRASANHYLSEAQPRSIVQVGFDGRSQPMLRFADEMTLADHLRRVPSAAEVAAWREWGEQPPPHGGYRPLVNLSTGREAHAIGSALVEGFERLEPRGDGTFEASDGSRWVGCSDSVWRRW